jgi:RAD3-like DEAD/DEAH box helicase
MTKPEEDQDVEFFYTREGANFYASSASVGSGKTHATIEYMLTPGNTLKNFLYVAPTKKLVNATTERLRAALARSPSSDRSVHLIHSESSYSADNTSKAVLSALSISQENTGAVIVITTKTFLRLLPLIANKKAWKVVLDEAFSPQQFLTYNLGSEDREKSREYFDSLFLVDSDNQNQVTPAENKYELVRSIAHRDWEQAGSMYHGMWELADAVLNNAISVELAAKHDDKYEFAAWVTPDHFKGFSEVIFLAALFEQSILHKLWSAMYEVDFKEHTFFNSLITRNVHKSQGCNVSIGYLLHPEDNATKYALQRNYSSGQPEEKQRGNRVIDECINIVDSIFKGNPYLLQVNNWTGYHDSYKSKLPTDSHLIPTMAHGLDSFKDKCCIASLAVTNPQPFQKQWIKDRTGMTDSEINQAFRIHTIYQGVGRTAIREHENTSKVTFIVVGKEDADFLNELFVGSTMLGKIGDLQRYKKPPHIKWSERPEYKVLVRTRNALSQKKYRNHATPKDLMLLQQVKAEIKELRRQ